MVFDWSAVPVQATLVALAFLLCALIGMERQFRHKSAGVRTHALVGLGSAVFTLVSAEGFAYLAELHVARDPSRIAAQIVSGIGFLGAGVIFVNRDVVRGLTTAASIWLAAAIGMACGAGMVPLAILATVLHFVAVFLVAPLARLLPSAGDRSTVLLTYADGQGVLRDVLALANTLGCETTLITTRQSRSGDTPTVQAEMRFRKGPPLPTVLTQLGAVPGVLEISQDFADDEL